MRKLWAEEVNSEREDDRKGRRVRDISWTGDWGSGLGILSLLPGEGTGLVDGESVMLGSSSGVAERWEAALGC